MFTTNLSIIIITGTGAGHEPQTKVHRPEEKLNSTVICGLGLDPRADWGQQFGLPPAYHPSLQLATSVRLDEVVSVDGTHDEQESAHHRRVLFDTYCTGDLWPPL